MDRASIKHVAALAELTLTDEEETRLAEEVGRIVAYIAELESVDTSDVPPTANVNDVAAILRPDVPREGLAHDEALAGAPRSAHGGFSVPTFVE